MLKQGIEVSSRKIEESISICLIIIYSPDFMLASPLILWLLFSELTPCVILFSDPANQNLSLKSYLCSNFHKPSKNFKSKWGQIHVSLIRKEYLFFFLSPEEFRVSGSVRNILVKSEFIHTAVLSLWKTGIKNVTNSDLSINVSYFFFFFGNRFTH